jgi:cell division protein FtsI/penicillin-binding protein 2
MHDRVGTSVQVSTGKEYSPQFRIHLFGLGMIAVCTVILGRTLYLQWHEHDMYEKQALAQYGASVVSPFDRGSIFLSHYKGEAVPVASLELVYTIVADTTKTIDATTTYNTLSRIIPLDQETFFTKLARKNDPYIVIANSVREDFAKRILAERLPGISLESQMTRNYPQKDTGAKVVGFVGYSGDERSGRYGVERYYDDVLSRDTDSFRSNIFAELFADLSPTEANNQKQFEGDVVLTLDSEVERFLHRTLVETQSVWKSDTIGGIVMDPKTGAIIAMEALPTFDPNDYKETKDLSLFGNQLVSGVYEMGSIIKPLTIASGLDTGSITEESEYNDTGKRELNGYTVRNYDGVARGITKIQTILDKSLNVGIVFVVEKMGIKTFQSYFKKLGLGEETGIDLPNEAKGLTKNLDSNVFVDSATSGFGQGIAITPIQTIRALAALGNGGYLVNPHVVDTVLYENGESKKVVPNDGEQVFTTDTSERISRMLVHVVDTALKNGDYKMDHYSIAAKTGTAQMVIPGGKGYYEDRYLHSFFGYFPAYDPKYIIFLFHTYPKGAEYASATLTDPFFKLVRFLISYYEIPPDR